jgi:hypothetical protein
MTSPRQHPSRASRIRTAAISIGILLGMAAGTFSSQAQAQPQPTKAARKAAVAVKVAPLPEADEAQLEAAKRVLIGRYECEFGKTLMLDGNDVNRGYFNLRLGKQLWVVKPVLSSTGAIRMEDPKGQVLLLQILTKSMLMDIKAGHRLVDGCVHEVQRAAEEELRKNPTPSTLN